MNKLIKTLVVSLLLNITLIHAEDNYLNIDAKHFESITEKNILHFEGDVEMTKNNDLLLCQKLIINTKPSLKDPNKQIPKDFILGKNLKSITGKNLRSLIRFINPNFSATSISQFSIMTCFTFLKIINSYFFIKFFS